MDVKVAAHCVLSTGHEVSDSCSRTQPSLLPLFARSRPLQYNYLRKCGLPIVTVAVLGGFKVGHQRHLCRFLGVHRTAAFGDLQLDRQGFGVRHIKLLGVQSLLRLTS